MSRRDIWIQTYTGKKFYPYAPKKEDVCIEDIAHALSMICRFNGHCKEFYSVAQHSYYVSVLCGDQREHRVSYCQFLAAYGLMHDAAEAYLGDIPSPIKTSQDEIDESILFETIRTVFGLNSFHSVISNDVTRVDKQLLMAEKAALLPDEIDWPGWEHVKPARISIKPVSPPEAEKMFLDKFHWLQSLGNSVF